MTQQFLHQQAWPAITAAVKQAPGRCAVAVAYFADGAAALLPLRSGSVLVVDASDASVKAGRTCPSELRKLLKRGVRIHTVANLHAKVFVTPAIAFVGSTNASRTSRDLLLEAAIGSTDRAMIVAARAWVRSLMAVEIGPMEIERLRAIYRPPRFAPVALPAQSRVRKPAPRQNQPTWLVKVVLGPEDDDIKATRRRGLPQARARVSDRRRFEADDFWIDGLNKVNTGDVIVVVEESPRGEFVFPPAKVLNVTPCRDQRRKVIFFERPKALRRRSVKAVRKLLGRVHARQFDRIMGARVGAGWAHQLMRAAAAATTNV